MLFSFVDMTRGQRAEMKEKMLYKGPGSEQIKMAMDEETR